MVTSMKRSDMKPFQERAAGDLAAMIQEYPSDRLKPRFDPDTGEMLPFLCRLRAITGAGKTPMLALTATHLKTGIILWTTNRGAIISQTLANLRSGGKYAELLTEDTQVYPLGEMSPRDWESAMTAETGLTIFLATVASFNQDGDVLKVHQPQASGFTRWQTLAGKAEEGRKRPLYVFYDEGHGATERQFGKLRELAPHAFVLASASPLPADLADLLSGRTQEEQEQSLAERTVVVSTKEVVDAGLLKNRLYFVDCDTAQADAVREANDKWMELAGKLEPYERIPIACFIVNDTRRGVDIWSHLVRLGVPTAKIAVHLSGAKDVIYDRVGSLGGLNDTYTGKKSQDRSPELLREMGYTHLIWNMTLREGWDEPLAYVAYIDERGRSTVDIVQKIGRFVRQPDARPFADPDLNSAYFYLNVSDEEFAALIRETQSEMETEGYEVIGFVRNDRPRASRVVLTRFDKELPGLRPSFGEDLEDLDRIILDNTPLFAEEALKAEGSIRTRVLSLSTFQEDVSRRSETRRESNAVVTCWDYLMARLAAIDSRIVTKTGTIFSSELRYRKKMQQEMQFGSDAMHQIQKALPRIRDELNDKLQLVGIGRFGIHRVAPFNLVSPDAIGVTDAYREKYKVRSFDYSIHPEYNGMNDFEVRVAYALDSLKKAWCRNPVSSDSYRIPIPFLGADSMWFYPDFLLWTDFGVWAIDPKGKHLVEAAVVQKLLDISSVTGVSTPIHITLVLEGSYSLGTEGRWAKTGKEGFTLVKRTSIGPRAFPFTSLGTLMEELLKKP